MRNVSHASFWKVVTLITIICLGLNSRLVNLSTRLPSFSVLVITTKITASKLFTSPTSEVALNPCLSRLIHIVWVWTSMDLCSSWQNGSNCNIIDIDTLTETSSFRDYFYRGSQRTEWELRELLHDSYHHLKLNISKTSEWTADNIVLNMDVFTRRCEF